MVFLLYKLSYFLYSIYAAFNFCLDGLNSLWKSAWNFVIPVKTQNFLKSFWNIGKNQFLRKQESKINKFTILAGLDDYKKQNTNIFGHHIGFSINDLDYRYYKGGIFYSESPYASLILKYYHLYEIRNIEKNTSYELCNLLPGTILYESFSKIENESTIEIICKNSSMKLLSKFSFKEIPIKLFSNIDQLNEYEAKYINNNIFMRN